MRLPSGNPEKESAPRAWTHVAVAAILGLVVAVVVGLSTEWKYAPLAGWNVAALTFVVWMWLVLHGRDATQTASLAGREDPGRTTSDIVLVLASVASLAAVGILLVQADSSSGGAKIAQSALGVASVLASWAVVHLVYMLKYARLFYQEKGGIDFNQDTPPRYIDFAYLAFTIGMTFQVSDTSFTSTSFRRTALRHALLAYLFGTVIVASTINLLVGLSQ